MKRFIDQHRNTFGVEPIYKVLQIAPSCYRRHAAQQRNPQLRCARAKRDDELVMHIQRVWQANMRVYGADKVWHQMNREGLPVARCTVERLMKQLGLQGASQVHARPGPFFGAAHPVRYYRLGGSGHDHTNSQLPASHP